MLNLVTANNNWHSFDADATKTGEVEEYSLAVATNHLYLLISFLMFCGSCICCMSVI